MHLFNIFAFWLFHPLGVCNGVQACVGYNFWSGIGSDFGELTLLTAVILFYWHHTCHVDKCWRIGKHPFKHYKLCAKHHPSVPINGITHLHIAKLNKEDKK